MWSAGRRGGSIGVYQRLIIYHFTITDEQVCQNRRTSSFADYGGINPKQIGRLHTFCLMQTNAINHLVALSERSVMMLPFGLVVAVSCQHAVEGTLLPCLVFLKLKDWKPPVSAEESITSTPYSL